MYSGDVYDELDLLNTYASEYTRIRKYVRIRIHTQEMRMLCMIFRIHTHLVNTNLHIISVSLILCHDLFFTYRTQWDTC